MSRITFVQTFLARAVDFVSSCIGGTGNSPVGGCTDPAANNFDPEATADNGTCTYDSDPVIGCMDPNAENYNSNATEDTDPSSCIYPSSIVGCMDDTANNWNPAATVPCDSCCTYDAAPSPNYIDVICADTPMTTIQYAPGLYADTYKETCNINTQRPVMICLHPGSALRSSHDANVYAQEFASRGYFAMSADFGNEATGGGGFTLPKQKHAIACICCLIRYLRANYIIYGIKKENIFVLGLSAGALTAVQTNIAANDLDSGIAYFADSLNILYGNESSQPRGSASMSGTISPGINTHIDNSDRPNFFYNGTLDCVVPYCSLPCTKVNHVPIQGGNDAGLPGALESYNMMLAKGIPSTFTPYLGLFHNIGVNHDITMLGGGQQVVGVANTTYSSNTFTTDIGIVKKFAALIV